TTAVCDLTRSSCPDRPDWNIMVTWCGVGVGAGANVPSGDWAAPTKSTSALGFAILTSLLTRRLAQGGHARGGVRNHALNRWDPIVGSHPLRRLAISERGHRAEIVIFTLEPTWIVTSERVSVRSSARWSFPVSSGRVMPGTTAV